MSKNIFVGSLAWGTTSEGLEQAFAQYGVVTSAKVISDRETGRSRGFGFVEMDSGADEAIEALNGSDLDGRQIVVNEARPREDRGRDRYYQVMRIVENMATCEPGLIQPLPQLVFPRVHWGDQILYFRHCRVALTLVFL